MSYVSSHQMFTILEKDLGGWAKIKNVRPINSKVKRHKGRLGDFLGTQGAAVMGSNLDKVLKLQGSIQHSIGACLSFSWHLT